MAVKMQASIEKKLKQNKLYKPRYQNGKPQKHEILQVKYTNYLTCGCTVKTECINFLSHEKALRLATKRVAKIKQCSRYTRVFLKKLNNERTTCFRWHRIKINMQADILKH